MLTEKRLFTMMENGFWFELDMELHNVAGINIFPDLVHTVILSNWAVDVVVVDIMENARIRGDESRTFFLT